MAQDQGGEVNAAFEPETASKPPEIRVENEKVEKKKVEKEEEKKDDIV